MPLHCLTGARFTMNAEVLRQLNDADLAVPETNPTNGSWQTIQDPISGEVLNEWIPEMVPDNPSTLAFDPKTRTIPCLVRGIVDGGIRVAGTTERFGDTYENIDYAKLWTPAHIRLTKRDRITNIRVKKGGKVLWLDEEYEEGTRPTVFNVMGVTPLFDAFNRHVENFTLLEKI